MICLRLQNKDDMFKHTWHFTTKGRDGGGIVHASPKDITYLFYGEQRVTIVSCLHKAVRELTFLTLRFYHNNYLRTWGPAMHCLARQGLWKVLVAFQLKRDRRATEARRGPAHTRTRTRRELHSGTVWKRIPPGGWAAREIGYVSFFFDMYLCLHFWYVSFRRRERYEALVRCDKPLLVVWSLACANVYID